MTSTDQVVGRYLGHSAWMWTDPAGTRVVIDPYDNHPSSKWRWFLRPCPRVEADLVLVTHEHFDHNATERIAGQPEVIRTAGQTRRSKFLIQGIQDRHASPDDLPNTVFVIDVCGVRFCHLGDNRAELPRRSVETIGRVDVLIVPVDDSSHLLRFWEVDQLISTLNPRVVVPVHYLIPGLTDPASSLLTADTWLGTQNGLRRLDADSVAFEPDSLPVDREVWTFEIPSAG